jgi:hypothetical protein
MGFDVYGRSATTEVGKYFCRNVWGWRCIPMYIKMQHSEFIDRAIPPVDSEDTEPSGEHWSYNSGYGLNAVDSTALADLFDDDIRSGSAERWIHGYHVELLALPREECRICDSTGIRTDSLGVKYGWTTTVVDEPDGNPRMGQIGSCNACNGWGTREPWQSNYDITVEDLAEFADFLRASGGFEAW